MLSGRAVRAVCIGYAATVAASQAVLAAGSPSLVLVKPVVARAARGLFRAGRKLARGARCSVLRVADAELTGRAGAAVIREVAVLAGGTGRARGFGG